jgi:acetyl-CoA C-acetyltransferase
MGQAPARQVALGAGCDPDTPSTTINKVCASGMKAAMMGAQAIALGDRNIMLCGGMENMSRAPHLLQMRSPTMFGNA